MPPRKPVAFWRFMPRTNPAVATDYTIPVPGQGILRVYALKFLLTTDANVANRTLHLVADDGTNDYWRVAYDATITAGLATHLGAHAGGARETLVNTVANVALPQNGLILLPGCRLRTVSTNLQAGDQYSGMSMLVAEFPLGPVSEFVPGVEAVESIMES